MKRTTPNTTLMTTVPTTKRKYQIMPDLTPEAYAELKASIAERSGVEKRPIYDEEGNLLDGFARESICDELGIPCAEKEIRRFGSEVEKLAFVVTVNVKRRQLGREQKEELIRAYLLKDAAIGDNTLADLIGGLSKNKVADVRAEMETACLIDKVTQRRGADGKMYPAKYPRIVVNSQKEMKAALTSIKDLPANGKTMDATSAARHAHRNTRRKEELDNTETPPWLCRWLFERITDAGIRPAVILDPCAGNGNLTQPFHGSTTINFEIRNGRDFFAHTTGIACDLVLCNPPWRKTERFLRHITTLVGANTPIVLFGAMEALHFRESPLFRYLDCPEAPTLSSVSIVLARTFHNAQNAEHIGTQGVILWFNMPTIRDVALAPSREASSEGA